MIYLAHEDDGYQIKRVTGEQIRQEVKKGNQEFTLIDGIILKSEHNKIDVTNL